ncbi:unnamed protein product [Brassica napus]|uniref:(rape) hypothetical protein n=2 Tax=Brassica napus TaxID=3708 RepID=A0A816L2S1_BRANA|nr:unnamed protein product [Brassica napus]
MREQSTSHAIVCNKMKKVYPGRDGNPPKMGSEGYLWLFLRESASMTVLVKPTSGSAFVQGLDICTDMNRVYTSMGLTLGNTVRKGASAELDQAVQESLKSLNLLHGGVADKPTGKYSGGMKRRLSVAISLIGSPKV